MRVDTKKYLSGFNLDIRQSHNARFMDQKVTPDVLSFIAECIVNYADGTGRWDFTINDIWKSQYFIVNAQAIFSKPSPQTLSAQHEYDKFIAQPIKTLEYAKVLSAANSAKATVFSIARRDILDYIASDVRSAFYFLCEYMTKVLEDSGFYTHIQNIEELYRQNHLTPAHFLDIKKRFQRLIIGNTPIRGVVEVNRIFPKIFNVIAADKIIPGTVAGRLTDSCFYYSDLMYNRVNWRDADKNKRLTRQEANRLENRIVASSQHRIEKAKNFIKRFHEQSELQDEWGRGPADHVHHIFPVNLFPAIADYAENLIKLTGTQHCSRAHPRGNTHIVDGQYQKDCLIAKSINIERSLRMGQEYYKKEFLIQVINIGYRVNLSFSLSFDEIRRQIQAMP